MPVHELFMHVKLLLKAYSQQQDKKKSSDADAQVHADEACEDVEYEYKYKHALLTGVHRHALAAEASREAFEEYLRARDFTEKSNAFMHAELARFLHAMRVGDFPQARIKHCPFHVRELLKRVPVLSHALFVLCDQARALYVFDIFVVSVLEHMVLIEDVIVSGGMVPNACAQRCARYVENWAEAVAVVSNRHAR